MYVASGLKRALLSSFTFEQTMLTGGKVRKSIGRSRRLAREPSTWKFYDG